ncbi:MAG: amidohydrolase family protein [Acidimicrobiales bacterium]
MGRILITAVEIGGRPGMALRMEHGVITEIGRLRPTAADDVVEGGGGALIPGLHDHHVHLRSWAAALGSIRLGPPAVGSAAEFEGALRRAAAAHPGAWIRGVGYHESVAGLPDAATLDAIVADAPVRIEHRSGAMWLLNSAALARLEVAREPDRGIERDPTGRPTGRVRRGEGWMAAARGDAPPELAPVGRRAAALGVTAFTDADPQRDGAAVTHLAAAVASSAIPQRVEAMGQLDLTLPRHARLTLGPVKFLLDDDDAADVDGNTRRIRAAHRSGRGVAIHCVTRFQLVASLVALAGAGPGDHGAAPPPHRDRIEHGAVIPADLIPECRRLGLTVVTQPGFVAERGDAYARDVDPDDLSSLYRCRSLVEGGVAVLLSTDAPYSEPDPWAAVRAASDRRTPAGAVLGPAERISRRAALDRLTSATGPRVGAPADLCLLGEPLEAALGRSISPPVQATFVAGRRIHP